MMTDIFYEQVGKELYALWEDHARWSQATFGSDLERGPIGPLKHLAKEVAETLNTPNNLEEYADIYIIFMDAFRRAGFTPLYIIRAAWDKMQVNKTRKWNVSKNDEPSEHVR